MIAAWLRALGIERESARAASARLAALPRAARRCAVLVTVWCPASRHPVAAVYNVGGRYLVWLAGENYSPGWEVPKGVPLPAWNASEPEWLDGGIGTGWMVTCRCGHAPLWAGKDEIGQAIAGRVASIVAAPCG